MTRFRVASILVLMLVSFAFAVNAQTEESFPTNDEINLVLTQTDRALQQFKPIINQEEILMGEIGKDAVSKDRVLEENLETAVKAFRLHPEEFNGPLGFAFFEWLDDVSRNALLCSTYSATQSTTEIMNGNKQKAFALLQLAQSCSDMDSLIYTVSENAGALYLRYAQAEQQLSSKAGETLQQCADILKNRCTPPKQQK